MEDEARTWWNEWSEEFQSHHTGPAIAFGPGAPSGDDLGLLGDVEGTAAIELGCGGGQFAVAVAKRRAQVTGVDISDAQLAHTRTLADEHGQDIEWIESSVTDLPLADATYDLAFSAWAFQWVENLQACFDEAYRVLKDGGKLVFSVDHPYYKIIDPETHEFETSYFDESPRREYSEKLDAEMVIYRRKVSETVNRLIAAGFTIEGIREPGYTEPDEYEDEFGSFVPELMAKVPPTIVYSARKGPAKNLRYD